MENLTAIIESILFVSGDPVRTDVLAHSMNLTVQELDDALNELRDHLALENRGIQLNRSGDAVFLSINPKYAPQVELFLQPIQKQPLSQAVLETLSVIAYRQPATKGDVEAGKANGMATIGVTWGYGTPEEVSSADHVFASAHPPCATVPVFAILSQFSSRKEATLAQ